MIKRVAILTNGGDCPGLNAVIRALVRSAEKNGIECYGFIDGYKGLLNKEYMLLSNNTKITTGLLSKGGTIIGSSNNVNVFNMKIEEDGKVKYVDLSDKCIENLKELKIDCIFTLGGDGTQKSARDFSTKGVKVIGIPKTIDNDVPCTEITFGYNTAVQVATDALDRLRTTAQSHKRVLTLEVMGRNAGWIALESAISGGADVALIPEIPFDIKKVVKKIERNIKNGKEFSLVVVSEGAKPKGGKVSIKRKVDATPGLDDIRLGGIGEHVASEIEKLTGIATRNTTLGYVQRGGTPTSFDRVLSTKYGCKAMELAMEGIFNVLVTVNGDKLGYVSLEDIVGENTEIGASSGSNNEKTNIKRVSLDHELVRTARDVDICLGD